MPKIKGREKPQGEGVRGCVSVRGLEDERDPI